MDKQERERIVQRLRDSKGDQTKRFYNAGYDDGFQWAKSFASADVLIRITTLREEMTDSDWEECFEENPHALLHPSEWLAMHLLGIYEESDDPGLRREAWEFWEDRSREPAYLHGFAEGALALWETVGDEV